MRGTGLALPSHMLLKSRLHAFTDLHHFRRACEPHAGGRPGRLTEQACRGRQGKWCSSRAMVLPLAILGFVSLGLSSRALADRGARECPREIDRSAGGLSERELRVEAKRRQIDCIRARRAERDIPRDRARRTPRLLLAAGYHGSLLKADHRMRVPSGMLGLAFRQHFAGRLGVHALAAGTLGQGIFGGGDFETKGYRAKKIGGSWGGLVELGLIAGPGLVAPLYISFVSQLRIVRPGATSARLSWDGELGRTEEPDIETVRWPRPTLAAGLLIGPGVMLGATHQFFLEGGFGGGVLLRDAPGLYIAALARAGVVLNR